MGRASLTLIGFILSTPGCIFSYRFVEPEELPGSYQKQGSHSARIELHADGSYVRSDAKLPARREQGRWLFMPGCAMGIDAVQLTPDGRASYRVGAAERLFSGISLYAEDDGAESEYRALQ